MTAAWRIPEPYLREAQDDATVVAIRDMERAGIDTITDGEIRRESYSNRFATALDGVDSDNPATIHTSGGDSRTVPRIVGPVRCPHRPRNLYPRGTSTDGKRAHAAAAWRHGKQNRRSLARYADRGHAPS